VFEGKAAPGKMAIASRGKGSSRAWRDGPSPLKGKKKKKQPTRRRMGEEEGRKNGVSQPPAAGKEKKPVLRRGMGAPIEGKKKKNSTGQ